MFLPIPGCDARLSAAAVAAALSCLCATPASAQVVASAEPVVITASRFGQATQTLPFGVSVLSAEDIARSGVSTVNQAIAKLLGVPARQDLTGGDNATLDLRGFGETASSNQIIIVDGLRLDEGDTGGVRLAGIPIDSVERIEVLRGNGTVLYGEGGTGGVIVVTTRAGAGKLHRSQGSVYGSAGSFDAHNLRANGQFAVADLAVDLSAQSRRSDNHRDNFRAATDAGALGVQWHGASARVALRHAVENLSSGLPGSLTAVQYAANPRQASTPDDSGSLRSQRTTLLAETRLAGWELAADLGQREKKVRSDYRSLSYRYDYDVSASQASLRARRVGPLAGLANNLVLGLDTAEWERTVFGFTSTAQQRNQALYARDELTLAGGTRLSAGARREHIDKSDSSGNRLQGWQTGWELGALQPLSDALSAFARLGRSYRLANADEYSFTVGAALLRPQTSRDAELGLRWRQGASRAEARAYRSRLTDEIGYDPSVANPVPWNAAATGANVNFDPTRRQGVELEAAHALGRGLGVRAQLAWRDARYLGGPHAGRQVPLTARRSLAIGADWQFLPQHLLAVNALYVGQRHPDLDNACRMPAYATLDLRYAYQLSAAAELSVAAANATDRRFYTQAFSCSVGTVEGLYPEAGRSVAAALRWRF